MAQWLRTLIALEEGLVGQGIEHQMFHLAHTHSPSPTKQKTKQTQPHLSSDLGSSLSRASQPGMARITCDRHQCPHQPVGELVFWKHQEILMYSPFGFTPKL